jgi:hypothetical protein
MRDSTARNRMSGLIGFRLRMNRARSLVESGYLASGTTLKPFLSVCAMAPCRGLLENGASAARIAIDSGFGDCFDAFAARAHQSNQITVLLHDRRDAVQARCLF